MSQQELFPEVPASLLPRTIWIVLVEDKHCDPSLHPFYKKEDALRYARDEIRVYCGVHFKDCEEIEEEDLNPYAKKAGYCYTAEFGESIQISVQKVEIR